MANSEQKMDEAKAVMVDWINNHQQLVNHIHNGAARGLYGKNLANEICRRLADLEAELERQYLAATTEYNRDHRA